MLFILPFIYSENEQNNNYNKIYDFNVNLRTFQLIFMMNLVSLFWVFLLNKNEMNFTNKYE